MPEPLKQHDLSLRPPIRRRLRHGFSLVELLVVIVVIAVLFSLLIPAVYSVRSSARRMHCQANLRSIGQAILQSEASSRRLPYGRNEDKRYLDHSWATVILPHVEEQALFDQYDWTLPWNDNKGRLGQGSKYDDPPIAAASTTEEPEEEPEDEKPSDPNRLHRTNLQLAETDIAVFQCPEAFHKHQGAIDYGGNYGTALTGLTPGFKRDEAWSSGVLLSINLQRMESVRDVRRQGVKLREISDGPSHTFMVLENAGRVAEEGGQWANGHNCFAQDRPYINLQPSNEIYSSHHRTAHALMADGSMMVIFDDIDDKLLGALGTRAGHEFLELEDF